MLARCARAVRGFSSSSAGVVCATQQDEFEVVVVGAGAGGLGLSNAIARKLRRIPGFHRKHRVAIIEPSDTHDYTRSWSIAAAGDAQPDSRPLSKLIHKRAAWIRDSVVEFAPRENAVYTSEGRKVRYDFLVVATGTVPQIGAVEGLDAALDANVVCTTHLKHKIPDAIRLIQAFNGGLAGFTHPRDLTACTTATHTPMFLADQFWERKHVRKREVALFNGLDSIYPVPKFQKALERYCERDGVQVTNRFELTEIKPETKEAIFVTPDENDPTLLTTKNMPFDFLHVTPQRGPIDALKYSELSDLNGMVEVCQYTLQSVRFPNVFGLGDCTNIPTIKTAAAANSQAATVLSNLDVLRRGRELDTEWGERYWGYTANATITSPKKLLMAENTFIEDVSALESFFFDQKDESKMAYFIHEKVFPNRVYWKRAVRGKFLGPDTLRKVMLADTPWKEYTTPDFYDNGQSSQH